jgi:hypothetical protein
MQVFLIATPAPAASSSPGMRVFLPRLSHRPLCCLLPSQQAMQAALLLCHQQWLLLITASAFIAVCMHLHSSACLLWLAACRWPCCCSCCCYEP